MIDNRMLGLSQREADVALRPTRPRKTDLFGRKLADVARADAIGRLELLS